MPSAQHAPTSDIMLWFRKRAAAAAILRKRLNKSAAYPSASPKTESQEESLYNPISLKMVGRLLRTLAPYKYAYISVCLCGLLIAFFEMIPPKLVGNAIDTMSHGSFSMKPILQIAAIWIGLTVIMQALHYWQIGLANRYGEKVLSNIRNDLFRQLQRLSMSYYDRTQSGRIISRVANDIDAMRGILMWGLNTLVANVALMLFAGVMFIMTDLSLFLAVIWLGPLTSIVSYFFGRKMGAAWQKVRSHVTLVNSNQAENIAGVRVIAAYNRQEINSAHFDKLQKINTTNNIAASRINGLFQPFLQLVRFTGQGIILVYGAYAVSQGQLKAGQMVAASLYWECLMQPAVGFANLLNDLMLAMAGAERIFALLDEKPDVIDHPEAQDLPKLQGTVECDSVSFGYKPDRQILHHVSFKVPAGSTVALVGATGSGKSTIISLLSRFYQPTAGRILFDGYDLSKVKLASLSRQTAMVLQTNFLFSGRVIDNLRYANPSITDEDVVAAAKALGCHESFLRLSDGYETVVGERGAALSLGERQLICFTRALLANPRILLLDEATSSMDSATEKVLQTALSRLVADRTTFIVAHRLSTIVNADIILVLDEGRILEQGTHASLLAKGGKYAQLYAHSLLTSSHV